MEWWQAAAWIAGQIITAAAVWGGIRADIRNLHELVSQASSSTARAHERIDRLTEHRRA